MTRYGRTRRRARQRFAWICSLGVLLVSGVSLCGQTKKLDRWVLDNAHIGPDSPLEIPAGSTYNARVEYPNPDGPTMQLPATIVWSIAPAVKGINIDRDSGKITVDAGVPSGTTAIVHANVNNGVRKLTAKVFVYSATENPLVGHWTVTSALGCGENQQSLPSEVAGRLTRHWSFYADRKVWIGQPSGIAAGVKLSGTYEFDQRTHTLTLTPTWPKGKAAEKWKLELMSREEIKVASGQPQDDKGQVCGYVLSRNSPIN